MLPDSEAVRIAIVVATLRILRLAHVPRPIIAEAVQAHKAVVGIAARRVAVELTANLATVPAALTARLLRLAVDILPAVAVLPVAIPEAAAALVVHLAAVEVAHEPHVAPASGLAYY